jgi:MmyB-like transcription regulator ligand binding domain
MDIAVEQILGRDEALEELLGAPGVPEEWGRAEVALPVTPVLPIEFRTPDGTLRYFSTVTTLGTPVDITLQELRIECFFPADRATQEHARGTVSGSVAVSKPRR